MKILFVCSGNKDRSKTAEDYFSEHFSKIEFESAGTNTKICEQEGTNPLTQDMLAWADRIFVMEEKHAQLIKKMGSEKYYRKLQVLNIPDIYRYGQKELIEILREKLENTFRKY